MLVPHDKDSGFALVQVSIIIIIAGLIIATVISVESMVMQAKLRDAIDQMNKVKVVINTYEVKYKSQTDNNANTISYWEAVDNCYTDTNGITNICNGYMSNISSPNNRSFEYGPWHFWKYLASSRQPASDFSNYDDNNTLCLTKDLCINAGVNSSHEPFYKTGWLVFHKDYGKNGQYWQGRSNNQVRNILAITNPNLQNKNIWSGPSLTPTQQYNVDEKLDDGLPYAGKVVDMYGFPTTDCANMHNEKFDKIPSKTTNATYNTNYTDVGCVLIVDLD